MSQGSFTDKWIHSSQDRLPGSFMNENHHTMTHMLDGEERNRQQQQAFTKQSQQDNNQNPQQQQRIGQNSQLGDNDFLSQEPKRSVVGTQHDDFQKQQSSWIDENSDNYSRAKDQFPSAGQQKQPSPATDKLYSGGASGGGNIDQEMDYDPDTATKSAFQSVPQPLPNATTTTEPTGPPSVPDSLDSNRAIMDQPLVSGQHYDEDDIQPASLGQDSTEIREGQMDSATAPGHGFNPNATTTAAPTATAVAGGAIGAGSTSQMNAKGPLDASGNRQPSTTASLPGKTSASPPLGRGKYKKRNSTPDHEYAAALPVLQSYVPYAQGVAVRTNNETRYEDRRQQQAATNRRYSLHGADEEHHGFSPVNNPGASDKQAAAAGGRRRSSLAESITKIFRRNSGTK